MPRDLCIRWAPCLNCSPRACGMVPTLVPIGPGLSWGNSRLHHPQSPPTTSVQSLSIPRYSTGVLVPRERKRQGPGFMLPASRAGTTRSAHRGARGRPSDSMQTRQCASTARRGPPAPRGREESAPPPWRGDGQHTPADALIPGRESDSVCSEAGTFQGVLARPACALGSVPTTLVGIVCSAQERVRTQADGRARGSRRSRPALAEPDPPVWGSVSTGSRVALSFLVM